jgi:ABC-type phosphate transport system substrate-binding protein
LLSGARASAGDAAPAFRMITHPDRREANLPQSFVVDVFLKNVTRWSDGEAIRPVDQRGDSAVRRAFSEGVLRRSVAAVKTYWQQRIFSGRGVPPPEFDSDEAVVRYVEDHPGSIGYIGSSASPGKTKVLAVTP